MQCRRRPRDNDPIRFKWESIYMYVYIYINKYFYHGLSESGALTKFELLIMDSGVVAILLCQSLV